MNSNGTEDLRVQKTITAIDQAFEELILTTDYEKITVAELARRARINKKTFYVMEVSLLRYGYQLGRDLCHDRLLEKIY